MSAAFDTLAERLIGHARRLAEAAALARRDPAKAWREARLVWPAFASTTVGD